MGHIEDAKKRYEKALGIFTEPMQYLTIGKKSQAIIRLIELNTEHRRQRNKFPYQIKYLEEAYQTSAKKIGNSL